MFFFSTIGFLFFIKYDGPSFYLAQGYNDQAEISFNLVNKTEGDGTAFEKLQKEFLNSTKLQGSTNVSVKDALCRDENYRRATWINLINVVFHEVAGINVIM